LLLADEKFKGQHFFKHFKPFVEFGNLRSLIGGKFIHNGYAKWHSYLNKGWSDAYGKRSLQDLVRAWNIKRSYIRTVKRKFTKTL